MIRWIVGSSMKSRHIVVGLAAVMMVFGFARLRDMPKDVLPEFSPPTVEVQTEALGLSAEEVEAFITVPLEQDLLNGVAFLETIRSESIPGLSSIEMIFEPGTDVLSARQVVAERLTQAAVGLPGVHSSLPQMLQPLSSTSRVMMIGLSSDDLSLMDLSIQARWKIRPRLMGVPGIANVAIWGQQERQLQVLVDPDRLRANAVSLEQIVETAANAQFVSNLSFVEASTPGTGGIIETPNQRLGIQHVPLATPDDLAKVIVQDIEGKPLRLGDVADVVVDHQLLIGDSVLSDGPGLILVIEKFPGTSALRVTRGVEEAIDALRPGLPGISIDTSLYRAATYVETSDDNLTAALIVGAVLMLLALGAFLFNWRAVVIVVGTIMLSLLAACLVLSVFDATLNTMIAAGLVLALVVVIDDAVGDVENVARRLGQRHADGDVSPMRIALEAAVEMRSASLVAALISLVAFAPVFFTTGIFGAFSPSIAIAYAAAVLASMVVALVVTPALGVILLSKVPLAASESPIIRRLRQWYERSLGRFIGAARPALVLVGVILVGGLTAMPFLERSLAPSFNDTTLLVQLDGPPGTSLAEMTRISDLVRSELDTVPHVLNVGGHVGRALVSDQVVSVNTSELWVSIDPEADYGATVAAVEEVVQGYPGLGRGVVTYPEERIGQVLAGSGDPVTVRVFGQDLDILSSKAEEVKQVLSGIGGIDDPEIQAQSDEATLEIEVDLAAAERFGIVPGDVRRAAATLLSGIQVGSLFDEQKVFEVVVWGTPEIRHDLTNINDLAIDLPEEEGDQIRLGDVADVRLVATPTVIRHEAVSRSIDVTAGVSGRDLDAVIDDVERALLDVEFPLEYHAELVDEFADAQAEDRRAVAFVLAGAIATFLLIQATIGNWRLASIVFVLLPLGLAGGALASLIAGGVVSIGSIAGLLVLLGLTARQAITQIRHCRELERREDEPLSADLVLRAARERFAPVLTSVLTTALVFIPLVVAGQIAGLELIHPMAVVILGGLLTSTLLTLFVVPPLYLRFGASSEPDLSVVLAEPLIDLTKLGHVDLARP
jgi:CzcA family heavy metal efflux pump